MPQCHLSIDAAAELEHFECRPLHRPQLVAAQVGKLHGENSSVPGMSLEADEIIRVLMAERNKLVAYAWSISGDFNMGEDVVQEVALLAMAKGGEAGDRARLTVWLRRATRLKSLEALRRSGPARF